VCNVIDICSHFQITIMEMEQCHRNPLAGRDSVDEVDSCYRWGGHYLWSFQKKHTADIQHAYNERDAEIMSWYLGFMSQLHQVDICFQEPFYLFACFLCYYKEIPCREGSCKHCNLLGDLFCSQLLAHSIPWVQLYCGHMLYASACYTFYKPLNIIWLLRFGAKLTLLTAIFYSGFCGGIAQQLAGLLQSLPSGLAQHENWDRIEKRNRESMLIISERGICDLGLSFVLPSCSLSGSVLGWLISTFMQGTLLDRWSWMWSWETNNPASEVLHSGWRKGKARSFCWRLVEEVFRLLYLSSKEHA
jgi:hypothetical protein